MPPHPETRAIERAADVFVTGDANRLVQVLVNLLNNAAKYTPRGGRIALTSRVEAGPIEVAVRDNSASPTGPRAASESVWRWCATSSPCTAAR